MIISHVDDLFIVKVFNYNLDVFNVDNISNLFKDIIFKIKKKYGASGLFDIDVYVNDNYGMIMEISNICSYLDEIDIKLHFYLDSIFMCDISDDDISGYNNVYYYRDKFYTVYDKSIDNEVIYKDCNKIIFEGIKIC